MLKKLIHEDARHSIGISNLIATLAAGMVIGVIEIVLSISFAALIFSGTLTPFLPNALGFFLLAAIILLVITTLFTSFPGTVAAIQDIPVAILAVVAVVVVQQMGSTSTEEIFVTVMATIALTTVGTGVFFLGMGYFRLGGLVRFLPYPVIGGFLAGTGWLLTLGGISTMTNQPVNLAIFQPEQLARWLPGMLFALVLLGILKRTQHSLVIPGSLVAGTLLFFGAAFLLQTPAAELEAAGWLLGPFPEGVLWRPFSLAEWGQVNWGVIGRQVVQILPIIVMSAVALLLNNTGLEIAIRKDMDLNHELKVAGAANMLTGLLGGPVGFHQLGTSLINYKMKAGNRFAPLVTAVVCALAIFLGANSLAMFPRVIMGGMILLLGLSFLKEWVIDAWRTLPWLDYSVVVTILLVTAVVGFLEAVGVGLIVAIILFVINYSRIDVVRHELTGATQHSRVTRTPPQQQLLRQHGNQIYILRLQGFIFFGTADNLVNRIQQRLAAANQPPVKFLVLDFRQVTAIDSTASLSFNKLKLLVETKAISLIFTEIRPGVRQLLEKNGLAEDGRFQICPDLDYGLAWCEAQILAGTSSHQPEVKNLVQQLSHLQSDPQKLSLLLPHLTRLDLPAGHYLIRQGDPPDSLYFIESGQVTAQLENPNQEPIRLQTMRGGHVVGEIGFYLRQDRNAAVVTDEPSVIYQLTMETRQKMEQEDAEAASVLHQLIIQLLAARVNHLVESVNALQR